MMRFVFLLLGSLFWICGAQYTEDTVIQLPSSQNLTVSFFPQESLPNDEENTCPSPDTGVTFSTGSIPNAGIVGRSVCYNLHELFAANNTRNSSGLYNYTGDARGYSPLPRVSYTLDSQAWDPAANVSRIRYTQTNATREDERGEDAAFMFQTYPAINCRQAGSGVSEDPAEELFPWIRWGCQSSMEGDCYTVPYQVRSFAILAASRIREEEGGKCVEAAVYGAGRRMGVKGSWAVWGLVVGVGVAMLM